MAICRSAKKSCKNARSQGKKRTFFNSNKFHSFPVPTLKLTFKVNWCTTFVFTETFSKVLIFSSTLSGWYYYQNISFSFSQLLSYYFQLKTELLLWLNWVLFNSKFRWILSFVKFSVLLKSESLFNPLYCWDSQFYQILSFIKFSVLSNSHFFSNSQSCLFS